MSLKTCICACLGSLTLSSSLALALPTIDMSKFADANAKFSLRGQQSFGDVSQTRSDYAQILHSGSLTPEEKIFAVTQMARLDIYRGGLMVELRNVSEEEQKQAMDECLRDIEEIASANSAEYHYFKIACLGFRGKLESFMGRVKYGLMMKRAQGPALQVAENGGSFEGGGIYRVLSALRGNRKAQPLGLYDSNEALEYANQALRTPAVLYPPFTQAYSGNDYMENHYYKAQAQIASGIDHGNIESVRAGDMTLQLAIRKIEVLSRINKLGERAPEALAYQKLMQTLKGYVDACIGGAEWKACLAEKLN